MRSLVKHSLVLSLRFHIDVHSLVQMHAPDQTRLRPQLLQCRNNLGPWKPATKITLSLVFITFGEPQAHGDTAEAVPFV